MSAAVFKAGGALYAGLAQNAAARASARALDENARRARGDGAAEVAAIRRAMRATLGAGVAATGAGGFALAEGSALDVLRQSALDAETDILTARRQAEMTASGLEFEARQQRLAGRQALVASALQAGDAMASSRSGSGSAASGLGRAAQVLFGPRRTGQPRIPPRPVFADS
jgi:hypothetical protein